MDNMYLYTPEICDGDYCPRDCDRCQKSDMILELGEDAANG